MKTKGLLWVTMCIVLAGLSACCHKPVSAVIAVQDDSMTGSLYAEEGGTLRFEGPDSYKAGFQVAFLYNVHPCRVGDTLHTNGKSEVVCHVTTSGTFLYQILPYPPLIPVPKQGVFNFAQTGGCTGCKGTAPSKGTGKTKQRQRGANALITTVQANQIIVIACSDSNQAVTYPNPPQSPDSVGTVLEWQPLGTTPKPPFGATFSNDTGSPCTGGSLGLFFGPNNQCTIDPSAKGKTFKYTVARSDCSQVSSDITLQVQ